MVRVFVMRVRLEGFFDGGCSFPYHWRPALPFYGVRFAGRALLSGSDVVFPNVWIVLSTMGGSGREKWVVFGSVNCGLQIGERVFVEGGVSRNGGLTSKGSQVVS